MSPSFAPKLAEGRDAKEEREEEDEELSSCWCLPVLCLAFEVGLACCLGLLRWRYLAWLVPRW